MYITYVREYKLTKFTLKIKREREKTEKALYGCLKRTVQSAKRWDGWMDVMYFVALYNICTYTESE